MKFTLATIAALTLTLSACAAAVGPNDNVPNAVRPDANGLDVVAPDANVVEFKPMTLPLGEVRGGSNMATHSPTTLLRALILPVDKKPTCTADASINPRWARCGRYELSDCTGGAFGFTCDIVVDDLAIGTLTSRMSADTWTFTAHWHELFVQGVRDGNGAVVVVK